MNARHTLKEKIMGRKKPAADVMEAARAAAAEMQTRQALEQAQRALTRAQAEAAALHADQVARRAHPTGRGCQRCGATHPAAGWTGATGVDGLQTPTCVPCADPQAGPDDDGWSRPVLTDWQVRGVLASRALGLGVDVPWLTVLGEQRHGLTFPYASEAALPGIPREPWSHVDLTPWRAFGERAARRHRAFGGPRVFGAVIDGVEIDPLVDPARAEWFASDDPKFRALALHRERDPKWTEQQIADAEEAAVDRRLAEIEAQQLAAAADRAVHADRVARARARDLVEQEISRQVAEFEQQLRERAPAI